MLCHNYIVKFLPGIVQMGFQKGFTTVKAHFQPNVKVKAIKWRENANLL